MSLAIPIIIIVGDLNLDLNLNKEERMSDGDNLFGVAQYSCSKPAVNACGVMVSLPAVAGETPEDQLKRFQAEAQKSKYTDVCPANCRQFTKMAGYGKVIAPVSETQPVEVSRANIKIIDGVTFTYNDETIRILGIDVPELARPNAKSPICDNQAEWGVARSRTVKAFDEAKKIELVRAPGKDADGRSLAYVLLDGKIFGVALIKQGYAFSNVEWYGHNELPTYANQVLSASRGAPIPTFEEPHAWRAAHKLKQGEKCPSK